MSQDSSPGPVSEQHYDIVEADTGLRYREVSRRRVGGQVWVDLAFLETTERARFVRLDVFEQKFVHSPVKKE